MLTYIIIGISIAFVLLFCFALAIASFSFDNYLQNLQKLDKIRNSQGFLTLDFVNQINQEYFNGSITVARCQRYMDCYSSGQIALSNETMSSNSLASLAIVSHELGHARQDARGNKLKQHWKFRRYGKIIGLLFMPLMLIGLLLSVLYIFDILNFACLIVGISCLGAGVLIFLFAIILKYQEIQIEKEASVYALDFLKEYLTTAEVKACQEFLKSARLTYWASLFKTMFGWTFLTKKEKMFR